MFQICYNNEIKAMNAYGTKDSYYLIKNKKINKFFEKKDQYGNTECKN